MLANDPAIMTRNGETVTQPESATDLASYQNRVARLTAENQELRRRLVELKRASATTERRLRAERDEGVAPQVVALKLALRAATEDRDRARSALQQLRQRPA